jgi:hypothetical protein
MNIARITHVTYCPAEDAEQVVAELEKAWGETSDVGQWREGPPKVEENVKVPREAVKFFEDEIIDGTSGQDRESYSDTQDRENYSV